MPEYIYVIRNFTARNKREITLNIGDRVEVVNNYAYRYQWWQGRTPNGSVGMFPHNHTTANPPVATATPQAVDVHGSEPEPSVVMQAPSQCLLDALNDSVSSGTFIDTKFYAFTRRDASGRVCSPRASYCNSRILDTVPYFSSLFSDGFSEGQMKDLNEGFPPDSHSYTDGYDYMSDSDLDDEEESHEGLASQRPADDEDMQMLPPNVPDRPPPSAASVNSNCGSKDDNSRMGKVAIICDMAAVTFEAMLYFLYTGEIDFAPLSSDSRENPPVQTRARYWNTEKLPTPSAKSIYRLADKYDIPTLKEQAKTYICNNLEHCDIVEEIFSGFTYFFPDILSVQVSVLVAKMNEESQMSTDGALRKQLRDKIASLSQPQARRAGGALSMIWSCVNGPLKAPVPFGVTFSAVPTNNPNWDRMKLAFLKSIATGIFIDTQFYAFNKIRDGFPLNPKPLFISSIVIEEWGPAITMETVGIDARDACTVYEPMDDYESWDRESLSEIHQDEEAVICRTEATDSECRQMLIVPGAWKTWMFLLSSAYRGSITFTNLRALTNESNMVVQGNQSQSCSPRSMYALAVTLGIESIKEVALEEIRRKLSSSNIVQELFSSFAESHKTVMDMEIEVLFKYFTKDDPKPLMDHIQRMTSGEASLFPRTLSLVYDRLIGGAFPKQSTSGSEPRQPSASQNVTTPTPFQTTSSTPVVTWSSILNDSSPATPTATGPLTTTTWVLPGPSSAPSTIPTSTFSTIPPTTPSRTSSTIPSSTSSTIPSSTPINQNHKLLKCVRCFELRQLGQLYDDLYCPMCPETGKNGRGERGRPFTVCTGCSRLRVLRVGNCPNAKCGATFV